MEVMCSKIEIVFLGNDLCQENPKYSYCFVCADPYSDKFPAIDVMSIVGGTKDLYEIGKTYTFKEGD